MINQNHNFCTSCEPTIEVNDFTIGKVELTQGNTEVVSVKVSGSEKLVNQVEVRQIGDTITITGPKHLGTVISDRNITISGGNVTIGGNVYGSTIITTSGNCTINGNVVGDKVNAISQEDEVLNVKVQIPINSNLQINNVSYLNSPVDLQNAEISLKGESHVALKSVVSLEASMNGKCEIAIKKFNGGSLKASLAGASELIINRGTYGSVKFILAGGCEVTTNGDVHRDYIVDARGGCELRHTGSVKGNIRKKAHGACDIDIDQ